MTAEELQPYIITLDEALARLSTWTYTAEIREMSYQAGSFGSDIDAETARQDLRDAEIIIDVCKLPPSIDKPMMIARGCRIAAEVKRLDGRFIGFAARERVGGSDAD